MHVHIESQLLRHANKKEIEGRAKKKGRKKTEDHDDNGIWRIGGTNQRKKKNEIKYRSVSAEEDKGVNWRIQQKKENRRRSTMANSKKERK